ncbi:response regulator [Lachnospiraceae bacterium KM106-2]|nr:response regulator [Lachnospiraceae bacterium KM106-2]
MIPGISLLVYLTGTTGGYDTTALGYVICSIIFLFSIFQHNLFDTLDLAREYVVENMTNGIIVLGSSEQFLHANAPAKALFPEITERHPEELIQKLLSWAEEKDYRFIDSHVYTCHTCNIYANEIVRGKMITIDDVTIHYNYTKELEQAVNEKTQQLEQTQHAVISSFANLIEARDGITGEHVKRTSAYVGIITYALKENGYYTDILTDRYIKALINAAPLHDIGKIAIPDSILRKPGKLTDNEYDIIKQHAKLGAEIIEDLIDEAGPEYYLIIARNMALYHHEKWDGSGYPTGMAGDEIPLCARIMAISDVYDALISNRSYKKSFPIEEAVAIIKEGAGKHFDPIITKVFIDSIDEIAKVNLID